MIVRKIPFDRVRPLSQRDIDYQVNPNNFRDFYQFDPSLEGLLEAVEARKQFPVDRRLLTEVLMSRTAGVTLSKAQEANIRSLLDENTFTVITAHQPALFTGPLYYVLKICSAIRLAREIEAARPGVRIVPVFISGGEDHDFEEINHTYVYQKKVSWIRDAGGSVGRMSLEGLDAALSEFQNILGENEKSAELMQALNQALATSDNYADFSARIVHHLFADYGVVVLNMDDAGLKRAFLPIMREELISGSSEALIKTTQAELEKIGYPSQAFVREINLFYLRPGHRDRIVKEGDRYSIADADLTWTQAELITELEAHPERFSPNVNMRPLYQESILPNLAYIGGGGELSYWLERKSQFAHFGVFFPCLIRRNSALLVTKSQLKQWQKLGFEMEDAFQPKYELINRFLAQEADFEISLADETAAVAAQFDAIVEKARSADQSLKAYAEAEKVKVLKVLEQIESRIKRSVKKTEEVQVNKIGNLLEKWFPSNGLQERVDNFFQFDQMSNADLIALLTEVCNPLEKEFLVLEI